MRTIAFALLFVLCTRTATASTDYWIRVKLFAPSHIEFEFDVTKTFEPIALRAYASTNARQERIDFQPNDLTTRKTFRNAKPFRLTDCVINAELEYSEYMDFDIRSLGNGYNRENDIKRVSFNYNVSDKPDDKIYIDLSNRPDESDLVSSASTTQKPNANPARNTDSDPLPSWAVPAERPHGKIPTNRSPPMDYTNILDEIFSGSHDEVKPREHNRKKDDKRSPTDNSDTSERPHTAAEPESDDTEAAVLMQSSSKDSADDCESDEEDAVQTSSYYQQLLQTALENGSFSTRLMLTGELPPYLTNAVEVVRQIIVNTLELPQLKWKILQATFLKQGILFEMAAPQDAIAVLTNSRLFLKDLRIASTDRDFFD